MSQKLSYSLAAPVVAATAARISPVKWANGFDAGTYVANDPPQGGGSLEGVHTVNTSLPSVWPTQSRWPVKNTPLAMYNIARVMGRDGFPRFSISDGVSPGIGSYCFLRHRPQRFCRIAPVRS